MKFRTRKTIVSILIVVVAATTVLILRTYLLNRLKEGVSEALNALDRTGLTVRYKSIDVHWRTNTITIDHLVVSRDTYDTTCLYPEFISARKIEVKRLNILTLFFSDVSIGEVVIRDPRAVVRRRSSLLEGRGGDSTRSLSLAIDRVVLSSAHIEYLDSGACQVKTELNSHVEAIGLAMNFHAGQPFNFTMASITFDSTRMRLPEDAYSLRIRKAGIDFAAGTVHLDTIAIIPHHTKLQFGKVAGHDIDRIEGVIPFLRLSGMTYQYQDTFALHVTRMDVQMFLKIFHDKRLPHKNIYKPLPHRLLHTIPFGLDIDSLEVQKSYVEYEEFAPDAEAPGTVYFDNLQASILSITSDRHLKEGQTELKAAADFMGQGKIQMQTSFPRDVKKNCILKGSLQNFPLARVNTMLRPAANLEVESGTMNNLTFWFAYNDTRSDGEVQLDYNDLKLVSLKADKQDNGRTNRKNKREKDNGDKDLKKDNLKTFIINAFVVRKNMDESVPEDKRTGTVLFYRDKTRSVFNYWWKSLFSGIKSSFDLDKAVSGKSKKDAHSQ